MNIVESIRAAGVVGAGGAGFPAHVKLNGKAEYVIANGAECEPLLRVDQLLMQREAKRVVHGVAPWKPQAQHAVSSPPRRIITTLYMRWNRRSAAETISRCT